MVFNTDVETDWERSQGTHTIALCTKLDKSSFCQKVFLSHRAAEKKECARWISMSGVECRDWRRTFCGRFKSNVSFVLRFEMCRLRFLQNRYTIKILTNYSLCFSKVDGVADNRAYFCCHTTHTRTPPNHSNEWRSHVERRCCTHFKFNYSVASRMRRRIWEFRRCSNGLEGPEINRDCNYCLRRRRRKISFYSHCVGCSKINEIILLLKFNGSDLNKSTFAPQISSTLLSHSFRQSWSTRLYTIF